MATVKLTKSEIDKVSAGNKDTFLWDNAIAGFGLKVSPSGHKVYIYQYRLNGGRGGKVKRFTIGRHGPALTADQARRKAIELAAQVRAGVDPGEERKSARQAITVQELCDLYLKEGCTTKKLSTLATDKSRIERHIKPLLGKKRVVDLAEADVQRLLADISKGASRLDVKTGPRGRAIVRGGQGAATRTVGLFGAILSFAVERRLRVDNPARGIKRFPDRKSQRFLSPAEFQMLGTVLDNLEREGTNASAITILRMLALTGARKSEIVNLRWTEVDLALSCLRLRDSKTGEKTVRLGAAAAAQLRTLERRAQFVFPGRDNKGAFKGLEKVWLKVRERLGDTRLRIHDLRHSFASVGVTEGASLPIIGALLGHLDVQTTAGYAHLADSSGQIAADRIATSIDRAMNGRKAEP